jgi:hypothetical protein
MLTHPQKADPMVRSHLGPVPLPTHLAQIRFTFRVPDAGDKARMTPPGGRMKNHMGGYHGVSLPSGNLT